MKPQIDKKKQGFYLFLMISSYVSTLGFGVFYFIAGAMPLAYMGFTAFGLFVVYGTLSFITTKIVTLFRFSIVTAIAAFSIQIFFTGGILSSSLPEYIIPPLLAYFYRPLRDRYYFMAICAFLIFLMWVLTISGITVNLLDPAYAVANGILSTFFVFTIVMIYTVLYRGALASKNRLLGESMKELQITTQRLIQSEKMASLGIMSAGVAHEINNPLNFIKGGISLLSTKLEGQSEYQPFIQAIDEGVSRASSIVSSLGNFSRETSAKDEECDLHKIIENCLVMLQHRLKYKVDVEKKYSTAKHLNIVGNEGQLHQAILNIISNAEQSIEDRGTIKIETKAKTEHIVLTIEDSGVGISKENLNKISDPFFTTKPVGEGTGLGLSITFKIIQEHNGKISVTSVPGKGTKFSILFKLDGRFT